MIDHFNLPVTDLDRSQTFYERALDPLGLRFLFRDGAASGFGSDAWTFGIVVAAPPVPKIHVAFRAVDRSQVDRFFAAALAVGGTANGAPGIRAGYDPHYYAAFVSDPDGHNVEAVCRRQAGTS